MNYAISGSIVPLRETNVLNMRARVSLVGLIAVCSLFLLGCPPHLRISEINRDPGKYAGKEVTISGNTSGSFGALGQGIFQVNDGTGSMWVYSESFGVPSNGAKVAVTGRIQQGFSFGSRNFAVILRETRARH